MKMAIPPIATPKIKLVIFFMVKLVTPSRAYGFGLTCYSGEKVRCDFFPFAVFARHRFVKFKSYHYWKYRKVGAASWSFSLPQNIPSPGGAAEWTDFAFYLELSGEFAIC